MGNYKAVLMCGGKGTRLHPLTITTNKHLLPIYNKPMIYYSLEMLCKLQFTDVLIITSKEFINKFKMVIESKFKKKLNLCYKIQRRPLGIADSIRISKNFLGNSNLCLLLGDNIFIGKDFYESAFKAINNEKSCLLSLKLSNPNSFGVLQFKNDEPFKIIEKPRKFVSNYIIPGIYFYKNKHLVFSKNLHQSKRGELEITDFNNILLKKKLIKLYKMKKITWFDVGSFESLFQANSYFAKK